MAYTITFKIQSEAPYDEKELWDLEAELTSVVGEMDDDVIEGSEEIKCQTSSEIQKENEERREEIANEILEGIETSAVVKLVSGDTAIDVELK